MLTRSRKALAASLALVFLAGVAVYAQMQPTARRTPKQRPGIAGQRMQISPEQRRQHMLMFASLQRLLLPPGPGQLHKFAIALGLTEEQKQQIKALYEQFQNTLKSVGPDRGAAVKGVLTVLQGPSPSKGQLQSAANKVEQADGAILDAEFDFWLALKGILNPQQQAQLNTYMQQQAQRGFGGPRPGGPQLPPPPQ